MFFEFAKGTAANAQAMRGHLGTFVKVGDSANFPSAAIFSEQVATRPQVNARLKEPSRYRERYTRSET